MDSEYGPRLSSFPPFPPIITKALPIRVSADFSHLNPEVCKNRNSSSKWLVRRALSVLV